MPNEKWNVQYATATDNWYHICRADGTVVARIKAEPGTDRDKDAARLMAAAPLMLEVLQDAIAEFDATGNLGDAILIRAREAVRQATGRREPLAPTS